MDISRREFLGHLETPDPLAHSPQPRRCGVVLGGRIRRSLSALLEVLASAPFDVRRRCEVGVRQAGLPDCSSHGLKKAAATICANLGATDRQLMALFDWTSEAQANAYTRKANKAKLAAECATLLGKFFGTQELRAAAKTE